MTAGRGRPLVLAGLFLAAALLPAGCGPDEPSGDGPLPSGPPLVEVEMREYEFRVANPVPAGRVVFEATNVGRVRHDLILLEVPEEFPPIDVELRNEEHRFLPTIVTVPHTPPGARATFAVDLEPGRYALVCFVEDDDGRQHAEKGMSVDLRVGDEPAGAAPPSAGEHADGG